MKKVKLVLLKLLTICVIMCNVSTISAVAITLDQWESITEDELSPAMASSCNSYVMFNTPMANKVAIYHGFSGAEALKKDFNCSSDTNMYRNTSTGEIVLITPTGAVVSTGLYGGWR